VLIAALYHADQSFHEKTKIFSMRTEHDFCTLIREQNIWQKSSKKSKKKKVSLKTARL
jgi:predicted acetyltransferase